MSKRKRRSDGCLLAAALAVGFVVVGAAAAPAQKAQQTQAGPEAAEAHLEVEKSLRSIIETRAEVSRGIESADFAGLRRQMTQIDEQLRAWRRVADRALLVGAWSSQERKQAAARLIGRAESAEILAQMSMAIVTGYEYPAKKVPSSFVDATTRLYRELEELSLQVAALNRQVG